MGYKYDTTKNNNKSPTSDPDDDDDGGFNFSMGSDVKNYSSVKDYDSVQRSLPENKRDAGITKVFTRKSVELNEKYKGDQNKIATEVINKFIHSFPYLLFVSLPLYALFLKLLYVRRRKDYYFADHAVFLVHLYIFTFLFLLFYFGLDKLADKTGWSAIGYVQAILIITGLFYTLKAMKNFYRQGWGKTILKFIIFNILCFISLIILFVVFLIFSFYQL